ncbi:outer membrane transport energization protein TonB [Paraburkholderia caballeronis]|uniref:Protein TonB n=2 Tax=Paraburkholderia caballeronis TaxID=416943 RepID=A0A1H7U9A0_9BURK|nr:energy transducer TonB [Paraburkholderia caballeronis]PXW23355.1 outer membrane transport energization protein TonB [Paraburkholderia caballeronis]PXW98348.1 outer membrane transport energization protein TonB [Paraburkholderia caballeronis]RAJ95078.1 outer membrane transport energization protein TonB [Paraburkholderia caballeronis]TDV09490.1 outer membrane transport energization protein TonB [Paraburkholderia caballeronis]TDV13761.1 outer membrane transport energization protein TonB [Parabu
MNRRVVTAAAVVVALHAALIAIVLTKRDTATPVALESRTITAELLQPEPVAAPAAIQSTPTPPPPKPVPHVTREKPKVQPKPKPTPTPLPVAEAPSQHQIETPAPAAPTPPAPAAPAPAPAAAAPAQGKPVMAMSAPKNVSHLDCRIVQPDYPMLSKRRGETGTAYVRFVVGLTGQIENIELKKSSGYSRLDDSALAAMRDSSCKPYLENGEPVRAAYTQPFDFSLHD